MPDYRTVEPQRTVMGRLDHEGDLIEQLTDDFS